MKIRIVKSAEVFDVENREYFWILEKCGLIETVAATAPVKKFGTAKWWVNYAIATESSRPTIIAQCDVCHAQQIFEDSPRIVNAKTGIVPPSQLHKAFIEHCKKREFVPKEIVDEFFEVLAGVNR